MSNELNRQIAVQAKRLLLSEELKNELGNEALRLAELIERYEEEHGEIEPKIALHGKKAWYQSLTKKGQYTTLVEIEALEKL